MATWLFAAFLICSFISHKYTHLTGVTIAWVLVSALMTVNNSFNFLSADPIVRLYNYSAFSALASFLLTLMAVMLTPLPLLRTLFRWVAIANVLFVLGFMIFKHALTPWGILLNGSMSGCFAAVCFPLFSRKEKWRRWFVAFSVFAVARSLPIAVFAVVIGSTFFIHKKFWRLGILIAISFVAGMFLKGDRLFHSQGRTEVWSVSFDYFKEQVSIIHGAGFGSFYVIGQALTHGVYLWLHSDWMQVGFEMGFVGLVLVMALYCQALWKARFRPDLFSALMGYAAFGVANMPLRYPIAGILGAFLLRQALEKPPLLQAK